MLCSTSALFLSSYYINLHSWQHFVLKIASPRTDEACRETWQLVRSDYNIKMLKFTSLHRVLASIIYPINLRLKMLHMIPAFLEANLNGSLSRLKACHSIYCRNATIIKTWHIFFPFSKIKFKLQHILFRGNVSTMCSVTILSIFKCSYYEVTIEDNLDSGAGKLVRMFQGCVVRCWYYPVLILSKFCFPADVRTLTQDSHTSLWRFSIFNPTFTILEPLFPCNFLLLDKWPCPKAFFS